MMKRIWALLAAALAAASLVMATAAPAQAEDFNEYNLAVAGTPGTAARWCDETSVVYGCMQPYGDVIWVVDNAADGHAVGVVWADLDSNRSGICMDRRGKAAGFTKCDKDFVEGHRIIWGVFSEQYLTQEVLEAAVNDNLTVM